MAAVGGGGAAGSGAVASPIVHDFKTTHVTLSTLRTKLLVVGDASVGKTALVRMLTSAGTDYRKNYVMTTSVEVTTTSLRVGEASTGTATQVEFFILDAPGSSIFNQRDEGVSQWVSASMVAVVFDLGSKESFASCPKWLKRATDARARSETVTGKPLIGVLIGNKADFREAGTDRAEVSTEEAKTFAASLGLAYFETSAERPDQYMQPFAHLAAEWKKLYDAECARLDSL